MAQQSIYFSNKALNYKLFKELFEKLEKVEDIDRKIINITYVEKKKNSEKRFSEEFKSIPALLDYIKDLKKVDTLTMHLCTKSSRITLTYNDYTDGWTLEYSEENNISNAVICILNNFFKPNFIKRLLFDRTHIVWGLYTGNIFGINIALKDVTNYTFKQRVLFYIMFFLLLGLIGLSIYKVKMRKQPYINNKFWEEHKIDIIQNVIFYFLGVVTPYLISWVITFINTN